MKLPGFVIKIVVKISPPISVQRLLVLFLLHQAVAVVLQLLGLGFAVRTDGDISVDEQLEQVDVVERVGGVVALADLEARLEALNGHFQALALLGRLLGDLSVEKSDERGDKVLLDVAHGEAEGV